MLLDSNFFYLFSGILFLLISGVKILFLKNKISFLFFWWYLSLVFLFGNTFFPLPIGIPAGFWENFIHINFPWASLLEIVSNPYLPLFQKIRQIWGNLILFIPLGYAIYLQKKSYSLVQISIIIFFISLGIEITQIFIGKYIVGYQYRIFDIDDIILNTIWWILGYFVLWYIHKKTKK